MLDHSRQRPRRMRHLRRKCPNYLVDRKVGVEQIENIERLPDIGRSPALPQRMEVGQIRIVPEGVERLFGLPFNEKQNLPWPEVTGQMVAETAKRHPPTTILRSHFGQTAEIREVLLHVSTSNIFSARNFSSAGSGSLPIFLSMVSEVWLCRGLGGLSQGIRTGGIVSDPWLFAPRTEEAA